MISSFTGIYLPKNNFPKRKKPLVIASFVTGKDTRALEDLTSLISDMKE